MELKWVHSAVLFFALCFLAGCAGFPEDRKMETGKVDYQLQERCEKKCEEYFKKQYGNGILNEGKRTVTYQNHYNKKLNKCFIILTTNFIIEKYKMSYKEKFLFDVNYLRDYAFFHNSGKFTFCDVERNKCNSEEEWVSLVKPYMEE